MIKKHKKIISYILVFALVSSFFIPFLKVRAESYTTSLSVSFRNGSVGRGIVQYSLNDGASWQDVSDTTMNIATNVTGDNLRIRIVPGQDYMIDYTAIELELDSIGVQDVPSLGLGSENGYSVPNNVVSVYLKDVEFGENHGAPAIYDSTAHVSVTVLGTEIENPYGEDASEIRISVNGDYYVPLANNNVDVTYDPEDPERIYSVATINPMDINYQNLSEDSVVIGIRAQWNTFLTDVTINNHSYAEDLPTTKEGLIAIYNNQELRYEIEVPKDSNDNYNIVIEGRKQHDNEVIMGNFLWDYNEDGYTGPDDKIFHSTLQFIQAVYNNHTYNTVEELNAAGSLYHWRDAERKEVYADETEGVGEATFPVGTMLTVAIIPDSGYQLVSFGVNDGGFEPQEQIGVYTFEIQGGNFHLQAHVEDVDNVVNAENSQSIEAGAIEFGGDEQSMAVGTARLDVVDNNDLTENQTQGFEEAADDYDIQGVFDVSLYNTVFKGSRDESWDTPVDELDNEATVILGMTDNLDGQDIIVIHETHNGDYEVLDVDYDEEHNAISFETDSFSNYAIATKGGNNNPEDPEDPEDPPVVTHTVDFNTNGGSAVASVEVEDGDLLSRPTTPTKDGYTFGGWYVDPELNYSYDFECPVEEDRTLYARWIDNNDLKDYTVSSGDNSVSFTDEVGHTYLLSMFDILSMSKEEIMAMDPEITDEVYDQMMDLLNSLASSSGDLLKLYEIEVYEENSVTGDNTTLHEGPFRIKIKITDEIKKYNTFKLIYLKNDFTLGDAITLTEENGYLVGTIPHLSTYMLTGNTTQSNPVTLDNIVFYVITLAVSLLGLIAFGFYKIKRFNN